MPHSFHNGFTSVFFLFFLHHMTQHACLLCWSPSTKPQYAAGDTHHDSWILFSKFDIKSTGILKLKFLTLLLLFLKLLPPPSLPPPPPTFPPAPNLFLGGWGPGGGGSLLPFKHMYRLKKLVPREGVVSSFNFYICIIFVYNVFLLFYMIELSKNSFRVCFSRLN